MSDALIVGGGLAGGAAAVRLARAGRRVHLLERETEPGDKVCGEFLSNEAQRALAALGLDLDRLGATRIMRLRLAWGYRVIERPLPFVARGLSRKRLDAALLDLAANAGARVERGITVRNIEGDRLHTSGGGLSAGTLLLANGKHELRGAARDPAGCDTGYVGFKTYWRLPPPALAALNGRIDVILFDGGYAGLQLVEGERANLCLVITRQRLAALGGGWPGVLQALLTEPHAAILHDATPCLAKPLAIAGVPYGFLHRPRAADPVFRLGDQAAVIPSFCGEGMGIALHSAAMAAAVLANNGTAADHRAILDRDLAWRLRLATALQRGSRRGWSRGLIWGALLAWPGLADQLIRLTRTPA